MRLNDDTWTGEVEIGFHDAVCGECLAPRDTFLVVIIYTYTGMPPVLLPCSVDILLSTYYFLFNMREIFLPPLKYRYEATKTTMKLKMQNPQKMP